MPGPKNRIRSKIRSGPCATGFERCSLLQPARVVRSLLLPLQQPRPSLGRFPVLKIGEHLRQWELVGLHKGSRLGSATDPLLEPLAPTRRFRSRGRRGQFFLLAVLREIILVGGVAIFGVFLDAATQVVVQINRRDLRVELSFRRVGEECETSVVKAEQLQELRESCHSSEDQGFHPEELAYVGECGHCFAPGNAEREYA